MTILTVIMWLLADFLGLRTLNWLSFSIIVGCLLTIEYLLYRAVIRVIPLESKL